MIDVSRSEQGDAFPGYGHDRPPIVRMGEAEGIIDGEASAGEDEMATPQLAKARPPAELAPQPVGRGAGGVNHDLRPYFGRAFAAAWGHVAHDNAADAAVPPAKQAHHRGVIQGAAAVAHPFADNPKHQAGVVRFGVAIVIAALQRLLVEKGEAAGQRGRPFAPVIPAESQEIVDRQAQAKCAQGNGISFKAQPHEIKGRDQPSPVAQQALALANRIQGDAQLAVAQVAQTAMDQF